MDVRFDRNIRFFGEAGQEKLAQTTVAVIGAGGVGSHVIQQLALLGVGSISVVDAEQLAESNRNRYVTARAEDAVPGTTKVEIAERLILAINPSAKVIKIHDSLISETAFKAIVECDFVFGCLDSEAARLVLTELCAAYARPYCDCASDVEAGDPPRYGGRVCVSWQAESCMVCLGQIDMAEAQRELAGPDGRRLHEALYGVQKSELGRRAGLIWSGSVLRVTRRRFTVINVGDLKRETFISVSADRVPPAGRIPP